MESKIFFNRGETIDVNVSIFPKPQKTVEPNGEVNVSE